MNRKFKVFLVWILILANVMTGTGFRVSAAETGQTEDSSAGQEPVGTEESSLTRIGFLCVLENVSYAS